MTTRIGKYEVHSEIGRGAFGRVVRAYDPVTRRHVAIKVLIAENDPDVLSRFFLEVQATAKLKHKNIVTIYDFNATPPYIVMELVEGESLQQVITHHTSLSLQEKVRILSQAAEGLACAHKNGIIHRDVKPANVMVLPSFDAKIMDFGIARVSGQTEARRTRQGDLVGTILYMSPERILHGAEAGPCSDIFSFGVVGYELITGQYPFEGEDFRAVAYKITSEDVPPVQRLVPECPETLDLVIQRATAKYPEDRYQSMEEILFDLKPVLLEMAQQQAASVMRGVQALINAGQLIDAREGLRRVLELDPTNREARRIHDSLQKDQRRRQVRTKVDALLQEGEAQLGQRQFSNAIQSLESARHLTSDARINELLGNAKAALEANRQASRLLSEARREMLAGNLDAACENAASALKADPQHHDAEVLCVKLKQQIAERDKRARVERGIHCAEELLAQKDCGGARAALADVGPEADPEVVGDLRSRIVAEEVEQLRGAREQRVQLGVAKARQQMQANQLGEAGETLQALLDEYPDATSATKLLAAIGEHILAQRRADAISDLTQQALSLIQSQNFLEARRVLEAGLQAYPSDTVLKRLLDRAFDLQRGIERALAVRQILDQARKLQASGKIEDALALLGQAPAELGHDVALADLKRQLELDREQQLYDAGLREALAKGREFVDAGKFADAVATLAASAALYPDEPEFTSLMASAKDAQPEQEEHQWAAEVAVRVGELGSREKWRDALESAEEALKRYPSNATLSDLAARARGKWQQQERQYEVARRRWIIEQALASGNLTRTANELLTARQSFPGEQGFDELEERLRQAQVLAQLDSLEQQVSQSLAQSDPDRASQQLTAAQGLADHPRWQALQRELTRRQADGKLLQELVRDNPPEREAAALHDAIHTGQQRSPESERAHRLALEEEAERLRAAGEHHGDPQVLLEREVRGDPAIPSGRRASTRRVGPAVAILVVAGLAFTFSSSGPDEFLLRVIFLSFAASGVLAAMSLARRSPTPTYWMSASEVAALPLRMAITHLRVACALGILFVLLFLFAALRQFGVAVVGVLILAAWASIIWFWFLSFFTLTWFAIWVTKELVGKRIPTPTKEQRAPDMRTGPNFDTYPGECRCTCHEGLDVIHVVECCHPCATCGTRIQRNRQFCQKCDQLTYRL